MPTSDQGTAVGEEVEKVWNRDIASCQPFFIGSSDEGALSYCATSITNRGRTQHAIRSTLDGYVETTSVE